MERQIEAEYLGTGQVSLTAKHFAFMSPDSLRAAEASECAAEQGKFWPYRDKLFENQRTQGGFSAANLQRYANEVGLDGQKLSACLSSGRATQKVRADAEEGRRLGVQGTPTLIINGRTLDSWGPFERVQAVIEEELRK